MMARSHTFVGIFWFNNLGWRMESPSGWNHSTPGSFSLVTWKPKIDGNRKKGFFTFQNGQQIPLFTTRILGVFGFFMFSFLGCKRCSHFDSIGFFCFLLLFPCVFLFKFGSPFPVSFAVLFFQDFNSRGFSWGKNCPPQRQPAPSPGDEGARDVGACAWRWCTKVPGWRGWRDGWMITITTNN